MGKRQRDNSDQQGPSADPAPRPLGWVEMATLLGLAAAVVFGYTGWRETQALSKSVTDRLGQVETRLTQISAKVEAAARPAAAPQRGPDPNRVYAVRTDGAPFEGPKSAPVTIAEFSDFQ